MYQYLKETLGSGLFLHIMGLWGCTAFILLLAATAFNFDIPYILYRPLNIVRTIVFWIFWYCGIASIFISIADILYAHDATVSKKEREKYYNAGKSGLTLTIPLLLLALFLGTISSLFYFG